MTDNAANNSIKSDVLIFTLNLRDGLFPLGQILSTPGVLETFRQEGTNGLEYLRRHVTGDFAMPAYGMTKPPRCPQTSDHSLKRISSRMH
jgi:hypothetical protein